MIVGIGTTTPSEKLEVDGNITASPATLSNHVVVKSQLDAVKPYKVYTALLSIGSGTCAEQTVYENTIGVTPSFSIGSGAKQSSINFVRLDRIQLTLNNHVIRCCGG